MDAPQLDRANVVRRAFSLPATSAANGCAGVRDWDATSQGSPQSYAEFDDGESPGHIEEQSPIANKRNATWRLGAKVQGQFGCVHRAMDMTTGCMFAVRSFELCRGDAQQSALVEDFKNEVEHWRQLRHPNLMQIQGYTHMADCFYIHLELVPHGSVACMLEEYGPLSGPLLRKAARGSLQALEYLHSREPALPHGNMRAASILIDDGFQVKLTGFGSWEFDLRNTPLQHWGSLPWAAPEVMQRCARDSIKADVWSMGCTLLEMMTAEQPWGDQARLDAVALALTGLCSSGVPPIPGGLPEEGKDLAIRCLQRTPTQRPSVAELLCHELVAGVAA